MMLPLVLVVPRRCSRAASSGMHTHISPTEISAALRYFSDDDDIGMI